MEKKLLEQIVLIWLKSGFILLDLKLYISLIILRSVYYVICSQIEVHGLVACKTSHKCRSNPRGSGLCKHLALENKLIHQYPNLSNFKQFNDGIHIANEGGRQQIVFDVMLRCTQVYFNATSLIICRAEDEN